MKDHDYSLKDIKRYVRSVANKWFGIGWTTLGGATSAAGLVELVLSNGDHGYVSIVAGLYGVMVGGVAIENANSEMEKKPLHKELKDVELSDKFNNLDEIE